MEKNEKLTNDNERLLVELLQYTLQFTNESLGNIEEIITSIKKLVGFIVRDHSAQRNSGKGDKIILNLKPVIKKIDDKPLVTPEAFIQTEGGFIRSHYALPDSGIDHDYSIKHIPKIIISLAVEICAGEKVNGRYLKDSSDNLSLFEKLVEIEGKEFQGKDSQEHLEQIFLAVLEIIKKSRNDYKKFMEDMELSL